MPINVIVGLPHLNDGPILQRARALAGPRSSPRTRFHVGPTKRGWRNAAGRHHGATSRMHGVCPASALDSAGFVATARHVGFGRGPLSDYVSLAAAYPFQWWASADYCVEAEIAQRSRRSLRPPVAHHPRRSRLPHPGTRMPE